MAPIARILPRLLGATAAALLACSCATASAATYGPDFQEQTVVAGLTQPTTAAWAPDGRMFVAEKPGKVKVVVPGSTTATTILDMTGQVNSSHDRGLLGLALDSNFAANRYMYLLYVRELSPLIADLDGKMTSRLIRVEVDSSNNVSPPTTILGSSDACVTTPNLPGTNWTARNDLDCIPAEGRSHTIGTVVSAPDGTLWVGSGDASSYSEFDPLAFRTYDEQSLAGKLMHVDRSGQGLTGHSFCPTNANLTHVCTKLHAKGFRNPFRFKLRADGGMVVGDVGWGQREEIDVVRAGGKSYGWPCYEGAIRTTTYKDDSRCATEYAKEGTAAAHTPPNYDYNHTGSNAIVAGPTYEGGPYPDSFDGSTFFGDYAIGFLKRIRFDSADRNPVVTDHASGWSGVDLMLTPNREVAYTDVGDFGPGTGSVKRIVYTPSIGSPKAVATATPTVGAKPLPVQFNGAGSTDPNGDTLTYKWDFKDGTPQSTAANPSHSFASAGTYDVTLTVTDPNGNTDTTTVPVSVFDSPPTPTISSPVVGSKYRDGNTVQLQGSASDAQDPSNVLELTWTVILHHGSHTHVVGTYIGATAQFEAPRDHDADSYFEIRLRAEDSSGEWGQQSIEIQPESVPLTIGSVPAGAPLSYGGLPRTAPFSTNSAIGLQTSISADSRFTSGGKIWHFANWSDGGARLHQIDIPATPTTVTANYREDKANGRPATASGVEGNPDNANLVAGKAVDDNPATRWSSEKGALAAPATDQWWQVDLGSSRQVNAVELDWETAYASEYKILTSTNGTDFTLATNEIAAGSGTRATSFSTRQARYVRVQGVKRGTVYGISFFEARVLGPPDGAVDTTPPETTIGTKPAATTTSSTAELTFASEPGVTFTCTLDGVPAACTSPKTYSGLTPGSHSFAVFATDSAGNADPTPATWTWTVEGTGPLPRVEKANGRPAIASGVQGTPDDPNLVAGKAVDGAANTRWSSEKGALAAPATDQWWQVDLGSSRQVDRVEIDWEAAYASQYKILTSSNGTDFTLAADETASGAGARATTFPVRQARYVRIQGVTRGTVYGISFWEARVLGPADGPIDTTPPDTTITVKPAATTTSTTATFEFTSEPGASFRCTLDGADSACGSPKSYTGLSVGSHTFAVAAIDAAGNVDPSPATWSWTVEGSGPAPRVEKANGRPATASSVQGSPDDPNLLAGKAVDGAANTRWSSEKGTLAWPATNQWWQVDLGSSRQVDGVEVNWEAAYASKYQVLTSTNGVDFTLAASETAPGAGNRATNFSLRQARYVRILGVERGTTFGISFWEARILGPAD